MSMIPDYVERKGSLFLRSDHMNYSRATLNSNWHQAREAEPKDYDISKSDVRDLCKTTYNRVGNITDGSLPNTTYQAMGDQVELKDDFSEKEPRQYLVNEKTAANINLNRDTGKPSSGYGSVLPEHHPDHDKMYLNTTNLTDFKPPYPYTSLEEKAQAEEEQQPDYTMAYKHCHSQFSDTADYRRRGRNTWQDESGIYANSHFKAQTPVYMKSNPIGVRLQ